MGIVVQWDNDDQTIIRMDFEGKWSWDELREANRQVEELSAGLNDKIDVITDVRQSNLIPGGALGQAKTITSKFNPNAGIIVAVGAGSFIQAMYNLFKQIYKAPGLEVYFCSTLEEARALVRQKRSERVG